MKGRLTKIESTHTNIRTKHVVGESIGLPIVGDSFVMTSEPLTEGTDVRIVATTMVQEVKKLERNRYEFRTRNSIYQWEVLS